MRTMLRGEFGDTCSFAPACMIFPKPALRREVASPFFIESQRHIFFIDRNRTRASRIDTDSDDIARGKSRSVGRLRKRATHRFFEAEKVIARMLPREIVIARVEQDAVFARRIINDAATGLAP